MYCYMNVPNTPVGVLWTCFWEYRRIFAMFLSIFCATTKKDLFSGHFVYKLENEETYAEQIYFYHFTGSETC